MTPSNEKLITPFIDPLDLTKWIYDCEDIWQEQFLETRKFSQFCGDHGIQILSETIVRLWQLGLLKADYVISSRPINIPGLISLGKDGNKHYVYADARFINKYPDGLAVAASSLRTLPSTTKLHFHPFRFTVICQYDSLCRFYDRTSPLMSARVFPSIRRRFESLQKRSGSDNYLQPFIAANNIASLAIATEPWAYPRIFHRWRFRLLNEVTHQKNVNELWTKLENIYKSIGEKPIGKAWEELNWYSTQHEPNRELHQKLRLANNDVRERKLKGPLAGALYLKTIAEVIRRAAEKTFKTEWNEEGDGWDSKNYKIARYGTSRIFDATGRVTDDVLRSWWPNFGLHARLYVEGYTEWGAINYYIDHNSSGIDLINLKGEFKGTFLNHLKNDLKNGIYSFVILDGDNKDNLRILEKAAENGNFFGVWYKSTPDFEFANFQLSELQEILWQIAVENGANPTSKAKLFENTKDCQNSSELVKAARKSIEIAGLKKDEKWGIRLMQFAERKPNFDDGNERPIVGALRDAVRAAEGMFSHSSDMQMSRVDPKTGKFVDK